MFGLLVLLFLGVWIAITLFAIKFGAKHSGKKGALLGFMLTMGGIVGYWIIEYIHIQRTVTKLCETEGGIKIYVTPEEWRQQIGEEEWKHLIVYDVHSDLSDIKGHYKDFEGNKYYAVGKRNARIISYSHYSEISQYTRKMNKIFFDSKGQQILLKTTAFSVGVGSFASNGNYKEWINYVQGCTNEDLGVYQFINRYSNNSTGENK